MAENSPGRSDPRIGGAVTVGAGRGFRLRFGFRWESVMWAVRVEVGGVGSRSQLFVRNVDSGCCRVPGGRSLGRVLLGKSGKVRDWLCHRAAIV